MGFWTDLGVKVRKYYSFTPSEITALAFTTLIMGFVISFNDWGTDAFNAREGVSNLIVSVIIVGISILIHDFGQRIIALVSGLKLEFKAWTIGLFIALFVSFITDGNIWLTIPGGFIVHHLAGQRLGWFRYDINMFNIGMVALAGPLASITFMIFLKILGTFVASPFIQKALIFNIVFVIISMIPIPPLNGSKIYFGSRMAYSFLMPFVVLTCILLIIPIPTLLALILSFLAGVGLWITYYLVFEQHVW